MLKITKPAKLTAPFTPNLLPYKIHQDGPVNASSRYWSPQLGADGKPEAYFRGRKLQGREVKLPEGYRGVIVKANGFEKEVDVPGGEGEVENVSEVKVLEEVGSFQEVMAWGHECQVDDDDAFVKGIEEWINFSEAMHQPGGEGKDAQKGS